MSGEVVDVGGAPAVGNVLGFSLLLRDRKALLRLDRRPLGPGLALADYEAEIPGVSFPLQAPVSAAVFRNRRCRAVRLRLTLELRTLQTWFETRLRGVTLASLHVEHVRVELADRPDPTLPPCPCLYLEGRDPQGRFAWLLVVLQLVPSRRLIDVRPIRMWLLGTTAVNPSAVWHAAVQRFDGNAPDGVVSIDPTRAALLRPFVESGWKAPDLSALAVVSPALSSSSSSAPPSASSSCRSTAPARRRPAPCRPVLRPTSRIRCMKRSHGCGRRCSTMPRSRS